MNLTDDQIVISGISGRFPKSESVEQFWSNLVSGHPLTTRDERRWPIGEKLKVLQIYTMQRLYSLPPITGRINCIEKVDADFFDLSDEINNVDPSIRIDYEVIFEAIWDAGVHVFDLKGTQVSLIRSHCYDDSYCPLSNMQKQSVHRVSVGEVASFFSFTGPCFEIDAACASSLLALNEGYNLMNKQLCQSFIVVGNTVQLNPSNSLAFRTIKMNSADGVSKCLDEAADGYSRSEAIGALFVQRHKDAKRIYASILSSVTNTDGYKEEGITYPKSTTQAALMQLAIKKANIDPLDVEYVEGHLTGTSAGDVVECESILKAYREDSKKPLLLGCLKSNIGHTEGSSGVCSITKIALIFQNREIPPNIHFKKPNPNIDGLISGVLLPVIKNLKFEGDIIGANSFGFGGSNVSCILKANTKRLSEESIKIAPDIPRLINICGRTEEGINHTIAWIENNRDKVTPDFLSLLNDVSKTPPNSKMNYRGYVIIDEKNDCVKKHVSKNEEKRELWFLFSGFGGQWSAMAAGLMHFGPFAASIRETAKAVHELGIDLITALTNPCFDLAQNFKECVFAVVAVQLALYDTFSSVGLIPDKYVGTSLGEIVCAIIDGVISRKEALDLFAKFGNEVFKQNRSSDKLMITVEGDSSHIEQYCPAEVYSATDLIGEGIHLFGGEKKEVIKFSERLTAANIGWRFENTFNFLSHCPGLDPDDYDIDFKKISLIIDDFKKRNVRPSPKWINIR